MDTDPKPQTDQKGHLTRTQLYYVCGFFSILILMLAGYIIYDSYSTVYCSDSSDSSETTSTTDSSDDLTLESDVTPEEILETTEFETFDGEYITGSIPETWTLNEYVDGENLEEYTESTFSGFTGLEILNDTGKALFSLNGHGDFGGGCWIDGYVRFTDSDKEYYDEETQNSFEGCEKYISEIFIPDDEFASYTFFDIPVRRTTAGAPRHLCIDITDTGDTFDCEFSSTELIDIPSLAYKTTYLDTVGKTRTSINFIIEYKGDASESDLVLLDSVLGSLDVK
jgi:hypothetical protein